MLIIFLAGSSVFAPEANAAELQLNSDIGMQKEPALFASTVVWSDDRNGNWDIWMYDLMSETEIQLTNDPHNQDQVCIYGGYVVWRDDRNGNYDIYMHDPASGKNVQLTTDTGNQSSPCIYGPWIVWEDDRNGNYDLYLFDINLDREIRLTTDTANQVSPAIFGDTVAYLDDSDGDYEVYKGVIPPTFSDPGDMTGFPGDGIELPDEVLTYILEPKKVTDDSIDQDPPRIWGLDIVWSDASAGNKDIYRYSIITGDATRLTSEPSNQEDPTIYASTILWVDYRSGNADIYKYNTITSVHDILTATSRNERSPAIFDNRIVWESESNGDSDIFYRILDSGTDPLPDRLKVDNTAGTTTDESSSETMALIGIVSVSIVVILVFWMRIRKRPFVRKKPEHIPTLQEINRLKTKEDYIRLCNKLGLPIDGNKKRLRKRLVAYVQMRHQERRKEEERKRGLEEESERGGEWESAGRRRIAFLGNLRRGVDTGLDDDRVVPSNIDYSSVQLEWDDGWFSSNMISLNELLELGLIADYDKTYEEAMPGPAEVVEAPAPEPAQKRVKPLRRTGPDKTKLDLDWDDGMEAIGILR